jgi:hypothetical protein
MYPKRRNHSEQGPDCRRDAATARLWMPRYILEITELPTQEMKVNRFNGFRTSQSEIVGKSTQYMIGLAHFESTVSLHSQPAISIQDLNEPAIEALNQTKIDFLTL